MTKKKTQRTPYYVVTGGVPTVELTPLKNKDYGYNIQTITRAIPKGKMTTVEYNKVLSKEYSRLLSVAKKRIKSFEKAGIQSDLAKTAKKELKNLSSLSKNQSTRQKQLLKGLTSVNRYLSKETSSVRGYKKDANDWIAKMREKGFDVNKDNYAVVMDTLSYLSTEYQGLIYDSDGAIEIAINTVNEKMKKRKGQTVNQYMSKSSITKIRKEVVEKYETSVTDREEIARALNSRIW